MFQLICEYYALEYLCEGRRPIGMYFDWYRHEIWPLLSLQKWHEEVPTSPGRGGGYTTQNDTDSS